jgi:hypothetical protein
VFQLVRIARALTIVALALAMTGAGATPSAAGSSTPAAVFVRQVDDTCAEAATHRFADVSPHSVHSASISCVRHFGIAAGRNETSFAPASLLRRDQLASFLARTVDAAGIPLPDTDQDFFADDDGNVHEDAINRLAAAGLVPTTATTFGVSVAPSRAEMAELTAAMLRHAKVLPTTTADHFTDDDGITAEASINALAHAGVVAGTAYATYSPAGRLRRDEMATFLTRSLDLIRNGGSLPERPAARRAPEGWPIAGGTSRVAGRGGPTVRYTVEIADGLHRSQDLDGFAAFVDATLSDARHGWTSRGTVMLQRVEDPSQARIRVLLASPATVDRLCGQVGLRTGGIYSCWNGRFATLNSNRWFGGVAHVPDLTLYRTYLVNHEVGHGLGHGHRACPGPGRLAPVMMQLSKSTYGCIPNGFPYP